MTDIFASLIAALFVGIVFEPRAVEAQEKKVYRLGYLNSTNPTINAPLLNAFRQGLRDVGWIEGQNLSIEYRWADGNADRLAAFASDLVKLRVDVIVTSGNSGVWAARQASSTIPIVAATFTDPVADGLAVSLARPGGNVTGLATQFEALVTKQQQILKETLPKASRVVILVPPGVYLSTLQAAESAARALGLEPHFSEIHDEAALEGAFAAAKIDGAHAIQVLPGPFFVRYRAQLVDLAMKYRLPAVYELRGFADAGGLMSFGPSFTGMYYRAGRYVDRVLKGAKVGELPIEQETRFELVVNLKTAKALGLTIPPSILARADEVIE